MRLVVAKVSSSNCAHKFSRSPSRAFHKGVLRAIRALFVIIFASRIWLNCERRCRASRELISMCILGDAAIYIYIYTHSVERTHGWRADRDWLVNQVWKKNAPISPQLAVDNYHLRGVNLCCEAHFNIFVRGRDKRVFGENGITTQHKVD